MAAVMLPLAICPAVIVESVKASVLRVGVVLLLVTKRFVPSNSTAPNTGVVRLTPVCSLSGARDVVPAGKVSIPERLRADAFTAPATSKAAWGLVVPMPTLPSTIWNELAPRT